MNIVKFLVELKELHIFISKNQNKLGVKGDRKAITPELKSKMAEYKQAILDVYQELGITSNYQLAPTTFSQQRLWFLDQLIGNSSHYNMPGAIHFVGALDIDALVKAYNTVIERHDSLRTCFYCEGSEPYQVIRSHNQVDINIIDFSHLTNHEKKIEVDDFDKKEVAKPFDLSKDLLIRASLVNLGNDEYILFYNMHHITSDGWSSGILEHEFITLYNSFSKEENNPLPDLTIQYADYAHWQRKWFQGEELKKQLNYWANKLQGIPEVHNLPLDYTRGTSQSFNGTSIGTIVEKKVSEQFKRLCLAQGATLFMGLHAAFSLLLSRYSGEKDIVIGTPIANREQPDVAPLIGFFINSLVLRNDLSGINSFEALLNQSKEVSLEAYEYQQVPFEEIVKTLNIEHTLSYPPIFQVMLILQNNESEGGDFEDVGADSYRRKISTSKFELMLSGVENPQGLLLGLQYCSDLFDGKTVERLLNSLARIIENIVKSPATPLNKLSILSDYDNDKCLRQLEYQPFKGPVNLVNELFEHHASHNSDSIALVFENRSLTYFELNKRANQLAHYLIENSKAKVGNLIGLCIEPSLEMIVSMLAILKTGAAYVPLDPELPIDRLQYILEDARLDVVLTLTHLSHLVPSMSNLSLSVDDDLIVKNLQKQSFDNIKSSNTLDNDRKIAYVIYTSGSTGSPKGVCISHKNWISYQHAIVKQYDLDNSERVLQFSTISFDIFIEELSASILNGGTLIIPSKEKELLQQDFWNNIIQHEVSVVSLPTAYWNYLCSDSNLKSNSRMSKLSKVIVGGEAMPVQNLASWQLSVSSRIKLFNTYGPTETTVVATSADVTNYQPTINAVPIGKALNNVGLAVLDEQQQLCPIGSVGELYVGGEGLALKYLNQDILTTEQFIDNPFYNELGKNTSKKLYRTGDLVRWLNDEQLVFVGRNDDQVKIRGFRIELGEIEHQINLCQQVLTAIVVARTIETDQKQLVAYIEADSQIKNLNEQQNLIQSIKQTISVTLPEYMIPVSYAIVNEWPLTPTGKVDKKKLPEPNITLSKQQYIAPTTSTQKSIAKVWSVLLNLDEDKISVNDSFFDLGGHSLLTVRLISELRSSLNVELKVRDIFEYSDLEALARYIDTNKNRGVRPAIVPVKHSSSFRELSYAQQRLWYINQLQGKTPEYNITFKYFVDHTFDPTIAETAICRIIARHEILRTNYSEHRGEPVQIVQNEFDFKITMNDLTLLGSVECQEQLDELINLETQRAFDLENDLMLRSSFILLNSNANIKSEPKGVFIISAHHIAADGWSMNNFFKEFNIQCQSIVRSQLEPLPPLNIQYSDYAYWQRLFAQSESFNEQMNYWLNQLLNVPPLHSLPLDKLRPEIQGHQGTKISSNLGFDVAKPLQDLANHFKITPFMLLHSVFAIVLAKHSNSNDIVIGTPVANRLQKELEPLIGFFVNTLVLRINTNHQRLQDFLTHVKQVHLDAQSNQDIPFEQIVSQLNITRDMSYTPIFQIMLTTNTNFTTENDNSNKSIQGVSEWLPLEHNQVTSNFDLHLHMSMDTSGVKIDWIFDNDLFHQSTVERMDSHLRHLLGDFAKLSIKDSHRSMVKHLSLFGLDEIKKVVGKFPVTTRMSHQLQSVNQLFELNASAVPLQSALEFGNQHLTYQNLNEKSNQLARYLVEQKKVKVEQMVGLSMAPSIDLIVSLLAILKVGASYVPLDPELPQERLEFIIGDADLRTIITQKHLRASFQDKYSECVYVDELDVENALESFSATNYDCPGMRKNVAYVIYTSGSTGEPKGVPISHANWLSYQDAVSVEYKMENRERVLQFSSISFDIFIEELSLSILNKGTLVIPEFSGVPNHQEFWDFVKDTKISTVSIPTAYWSYLCGDVNLIDNHSNTVKKVIVGGEAMPMQNLIKWQAAVSNSVKLFNTYGPTETTVVATVADVTDYNPDSKSVPIGKPLKNCSVVVLDKNLQLAPLGSVGELYISGPSLAEGYLNREELTELKFINNLYNNLLQENSCKTLYKTGDLVRFKNEEELEFFGRNDDQVKVRGFRVELGEIEHQLNACAQVDSALVLVKNDAQSVSSLVAYIKIDNQKTSSTNVNALNLIQQQLRAKLPNYMFPTAFVVIEEWPLTTNGKINRQKLAELEVTIVHNEYVPPSTKTERILTEIWSKLLDIEIDKISRFANFFDIGGHSLLAVQMLSQVESALQCKLDLKTLYTNNSLLLLASYIDDGTYNLSTSYSTTTFTDTLNTDTLNTEKQSLFIVPALGLMAISYQKLAHRLSDKFDVHVLTTPGIDEHQPDNTKFYEYDMATRIEQWCDAIRQSQSNGHYVLLGHSFGANIAFEIAHKLELDGESVELIFADSVFALQAPNDKTSCSRLLLSNAGLLNNQIAIDNQFEFSEKQLYELFIENEVFQKDITIEQFTQYCNAVSGQLKLYHRYEPALQIKGKISLYTAEEGLSNSNRLNDVISHIQGWTMQKLLVVSTQGTHLSLINETDFVEKIIQRISE